MGTTSAGGQRCLQVSWATTSTQKKQFNLEMLAKGAANTMRTVAVMKSFLATRTGKRSGSVPTHMRVLLMVFTSAHLSAALAALIRKYLFIRQETTVLYI